MLAIAESSATELISDTTLAAFVRRWKLARLNSGSASLGYPPVNILAKCVEMGGSIGAARGRSNPPIEDMTDADVVQDAVNSMPKEVRDCFEAYHLGLIRGDACIEVVESRRKTMPHKKRALILGVSERAYFYRVKHGKELVRNWLIGWFDGVRELR